MEDIKYAISCKPDGKDDALFEIDCKKFIRNIEITRQMKDGVESVSISTINAKGAWEDMGKSADLRYGHLIQNAETLDHCKAIRERMSRDKFTFQIPISEKLFDNLSAKEKMLAKREKTSVKGKLEKNKVEVKAKPNKVENTRKSKGRAVR